MFDRNNAAQSNTVQTQDADWKAQGFLNLSLPGKDGLSMKLGAIPLKVSNPNHKRLIELLSEEETRAKVIAAILAKLTITYQSATPQDKGGFDLGL